MPQNYLCHVIADEPRMDIEYLRNLSHFFVAGINYKKSDASVRGQFAINSEQYSAVLKEAAAQGLDEVFVLSTCNRTEIYGFAHCSFQLADVLCKQTAGSLESFLQSAYIKTGEEAVAHLFSVGAGLDSQILGDYEIVGQLKTAVRFAKDNGFVGAFSERLINAVLQSSKQVKNGTQLSGGTVSVSFAAVQYIRQNVVDLSSKNILVLGVGKIGRNTCKNLVDYLGTRNITLINRNPDKARLLAEELGLQWAPMEDQEKFISCADIILTSTNAAAPIVLTQHVADKGSKLLIDLSVPYNIDPSVGVLPNVQLVNVDELSKMKDETLKMRLAEVPKAKAIIAEVMQEFCDWCAMRPHVPLLKQLKTKLKELHPQYHSDTTCQRTLDTHIQRVLNDTAGKIKQKNERGCQYLAALNNFINAKN